MTYRRHAVLADFPVGLVYSKSRNCSTVRPASRTTPPEVKALTGPWRGTVRMRCPSVMTVCDELLKLAKRARRITARAVAAL